MKDCLLFFIIASLVVAGCSKKLPLPADKDATPQTVTLFQSMWRIQQVGALYGHQDDLMCGWNWWYEKDRSDTKEFTGDYPAIAGFELGHLELGHERSLDSVRFDHIAEQIKAFHKKGGIITISWHASNPFTFRHPDTTVRASGTAWDVSSKAVVKSILPGGENHVMFDEWLERLATFFGGLKDENGTPIPFIFRPYHEHSGDFFWWGSATCSDEEYAALWRYTVRFLRDVKGIHNILYAYNTDRVTTLEQYLKGYPGDDIIDMMSIDMYDRGKPFTSELSKALKFVTGSALSRGKLTALSETGARPGMPDWWSTVLLPLVSRYPVGYVLTWRHPYRSKYYKMPANGKPYPDDFMNFYMSTQTFFLKEVQAIDVYN